MTSHPNPDPTSLPTTETSSHATERILILAPIGRDAILLQKSLEQAGLVGLICQNMLDVCEKLAAGAGALLLSEEALTQRATTALVEKLRDQPPWSDLPLVLLLYGEQNNQGLSIAIRTLTPGRNVTVLERPVSIPTLVSVMLSTLRARRRQYELRDYLLTREQQAAELERRVHERTAELAHANQLLTDEVQERTRAEETLRQRNQELDTLNKRLQELAQKIVSIQEDERRRVSRELHDEAGQSLTALKISLDLTRAILPPELTEARESLTDAMALTSETMERIRLLAHDLRPPILDHASLKTTLQALCQEFSGRTQLTVHYNGDDLPRLPNAVTVALYRILQEALTNIARHANAHNVDVSLKREDNTILLHVRDDGSGFDTHSIRSGIGLDGMRERLELLGGALEINSQPTHGTFLVARIPTPILSLPG
jgi:signal transduction histidine kinase